MRYFPVALALSLLAGLTASASHSTPAQVLEPRAAALEDEGRAALAAGHVEVATDAFEAALAVQPGATVLVLDLAGAARQRGMPGEAVHYYRDVLAADPQNVEALAGEGAALAEKGAVEKARRNLAEVESLCGKDCPSARALAAAIAKGPAPRVVSAEEMKPRPTLAN
ncbi:MAG: hypothetical protein KGK11_05695 [Sphingomonadales bacterium]|nr:hypothetical protein [Sphingomonadales bacterium]